LGVTLTEEEWQEKDRKFERAMKKKGVNNILMEWIWIE
jgi:hypothetical protein